MKQNSLKVMLAALACSFFIPCAPLRAQLVDGLLNYWSFEGNFTDTAQGRSGAASTVADNGIAQDETTVMLTPGGQLGTIANFTGGYVEVPDSEDIKAAGESLTISAWFRVTAFDQSWQALISHGEGNDYRIARRDASNVMSYAGGTGDIPGGATGPDVNDGQWHHVLAISEAGVSARLWVDGGLVATGGAPTITDNGQGRLMIGGNPGTGSPYRPWNGAIDDVGMWNKPLSESQIQQIYTEGRAGRALLTLLVPPTVPVYKNAIRNGTVIEATFEDSPTGFVDVTKPRTMMVDGVAVTPTTIAKTGALTKVSYTITAAFPPGSDHTVTTSITTTNNVVISGTSTIRAAFASVIDGPGRWKTEMTWTQGNPQLNNAAAAELAVEDIDNLHLPENKITVRTGYVHFHDNVGPPLFLDLSKPFPLFDPENGRPEGTGFGDRSDFAIRSTEQIKTTIAGRYWFNCNSDDGFSLWVDGELIGSAGNRGRADSPMSKVLTAGLHDVKLVFWERGGGAGLSLYVYKGISQTQPPFTVDSAELLKAFGDSTDTDGDGMPNSYELLYGLNPNVNDAALDKDADTLSNLAEFNAGTRPDLKDTDADGLDDNVETGTGTYVSPSNTGTNPKVADTDKDGLKDGVETKTGVYVSPANTGSNPFVADTDGDGMSDGTEVARGRNPVNAADAPPGLAKGLVAYWNFDGTLNDVAHTLTTDSTVADTGAFTGPATDVGYGAGAKFGPSSLQQNGGAGWVTVKSSADTLHGTTNTVSISVWVKATALDTGWQGIVSHGEGNQYRIARNGGNPNFAYAGGTGDITGGNPGDDGQWHHIAAISDPDAGTLLYVDGLSIATGGIPDINDLGNGGTIPDLFIGNNPQGAGREWNGNIDDVAIWGRVLTEAEITAIWAGGTGKSIESLLAGGGGGGAPFAISDWSYNAGTGQFTLRWPSTPGQTFAIRYSTNLSSWAANVALSIPAAGAGATSTTYSFPNPQPGVPRLFFRVTRN